MTRCGRAPLVFSKPGTVSSGADLSGGCWHQWGGCRQGEAVVWSPAAFQASAGAQLPHAPKEEIATEPLGSGCSSSKGLVET